jgi:hypothetical protein
MLHSYSIISLTTWKKGIVAASKALPGKNPARNESNMQISGKAVRNSKEELP